MNYFACGTFLAILISAPAFATITPATAPTLPTKSSKPIPNLHAVKNIDTVISEKVQLEISKTPTFKNQAISAASRRQIVTLEGSVENQAQADQAIAIAKSVTGVKDVKSQLTIKGLSGQ